MAGYGVGTRRSAFNVAEVDDGNFNYNEQILVETSQKGFRDFWIRPIGGVVNQSGPFTFTIEPMLDRYVQLNRAALEVVCRVVNEDGTDISAWEDVCAPINLLGSCMWENVEVFLNGQSFGGSAGMNAGYKAYMNTLLSYDMDAASTHLHTSFYHRDTPGEFHNMTPTEKEMRLSFLRGIQDGTVPRPIIPANLVRTGHPGVDEFGYLDDDADVLLIDPDVIDPIHAKMNKEYEHASPADFPQIGDDPLPELPKRVFRRHLYREMFEQAMGPAHRRLAVKAGQRLNVGFDNRYAICNGSKSFDMFSNVEHDFFKLDNHIGPGNKIDLKLTRHKDAFLINTYLTNGNYKLVIDDMKLHLRTIERKERIVPPPRELYQMNETQLHKQVVGANVPSTCFRIHQGGVMPKTIMVAMVMTKAAEGTYDHNPLNFHHFHVSNMSLIINGEQYPAGGLTFDFDMPNPLVSRAYRWVFENTGSLDGERGNVLSLAAFKGGAFLVPFDLTPDKCNGVHNHDAEYGYIDLDIRFRTPLNSPIYVLYYLMYTKVVVNDKMTNQMMVVDIESP